MKNKEQKVLEAALEQFASKGFHGASTLSIAEKAGVSNGTLFHYFRSKDALIQKLYQFIKAEQIESLSSVLNADSNPKDQLQLIWKQAIDWAMNNDEKYKFLFMYKYSPFRKKHKGIVDTFKNEFYSLVEKGIQKRQIRYLPEDFVFELTNAHVYGMVEYLKANPVKFRTPEFMKQAFDSFWGGITT